MNSKIGRNIKRLRREKNITQEQLAGILGVSCAAVSKWETDNALPDITMLMPLAHYFSVSTDELLGYDASCVEAEIDTLMKKCYELERLCRLDEIDELLKSAIKKYPDDFRIMNYYMWFKAGGSAANQQEILLKNRDEFSIICDNILDGCTDEAIRCEARVMQAKLCYASGETERAREILKQLSSWYQTAGQKTEQLFAKGTLDFYSQLKLNLYELASFTADKMCKVIQYDNSLSDIEKNNKFDNFALEVHGIFEKSSEITAVVIEFQIYACYANKLIFGNGSDYDIIRVREKELECLKLLDDKAKTDDIFNEYYKNSTQMDSLVGYLTNTQNPQIKRLLNIPQYQLLLEKYK